MALAVGNLHQRILCKICEELFKAAWWWAVLQLMVPERGVQQDAVARMPFEDLNDLRILLANIVKGSAAPNVLHLKICSKHQEFGANVSIIVLHCHVKWIGGCEPSSLLLVGVVWFKPILHQKAIHIGTGLFQFCVVLCQHQVGFAGRLAPGGKMVQLGGGSGSVQSMDYMVSATRNGTLLFLSWAKLQVGRYNKIMKIPGGS